MCENSHNTKHEHAHVVPNHTKHNSYFTVLTERYVRAGVGVEYIGVVKYSHNNNNTTLGIYAELCQNPLALHNTVG